MWSRKYYQFLEKDSNRVNSAWKVLHVSIFLITALNSFISSYACGDIFKIFNHRCILYASPQLKIQQVVTIKQNGTLQLPGHVQNTTDVSTISPSAGLAALDWSRAEKVPGKDDIFVLERQLLFDNGTLSGKIAMESTTTIFGKTLTCHLVHFVPLLSLVVASVFGVVTMLCRKGGRSYESDVLPGSWSFVYPVIFLSALMTLLSIIAAIIVNDGFGAFCSSFEQYTGYARCSYLMDYFTLGKTMTFEGFWRNYIICYYCSIFGVLLWTGQLSVTVLRLLCVADFQFNMVNVVKNISEKDDEEKLEKIHEAVLKSHGGMKVATELLEEDDNDRFIGEKEETATQV